MQPLSPDQMRINILRWLKNELEYNLENGYVQGLISDYLIMSKADLKIYIDKITVALEGIEENESTESE